MKKNIARFIISTLPVPLFACGGGSGGETVVSQPEVPIPNVEMSDQDPDLDELVGSAIRQSRNSDGISIIKTTGTLRQEDGRISVSDGFYEIIDADGIDENGLITDGESTLIVNNSFGDYDFSYLYQQNYTLQGDEYDSVGIFGVPTPTANIPESGSATFSGRSTGLIVTETTGYDLENGTANLEVDFTTSVASIEIVDFSLREQSTGNIASGVVDLILVPDVSINGSQLNSNNIDTYVDGNRTTIFGTDMVSNVTGNFYGLDPEGRLPAEVGGLLTIEGDSGFFVGSYLAQ